VFKEQLKAANSLTNEQLKLEKIRYDGTKKFYADNTKVVEEETDKNVKKQKDAQEAILKDVEEFEELQKSLKKVSVFYQSPTEKQRPLSEVSGLLPKYLGDKEEELNRVVDFYSKERFLKHVEATKKILELEAKKEEIITDNKKKAEDERESTAGKTALDAKIKEIDAKIKKIREDQLYGLETDEAMKDRVDNYAKADNAINMLDNERKQFVERNNSYIEKEEEKHTQFLLEKQKELLEKKRALYRQNLQDNENLYKDLVNIANQATTKILDIEQAIRDKRIEYNRSIKDSARDLSETIKEFHREDVERLQDYQDILSDVQGKEYYKGEFLARARDLTVFRDRLKEAVELMRSASSIETSEGKPDWQKRIEAVQGAVGQLKGLMGGLAMPQIGEEPTKPWEGRPGGMYSAEEKAAYQEQLKAYEKEKDVVEKQQEDIRKKREEVLNWYKQAVQELDDIQKKAHEEEMDRLEKEKDKWIETVETIKVKMAEVKKEIDLVREALSAMKLTIDNSQAKEAIDEVKGWLNELYGIANNVITLTVKSEKGGLTPAITKAKTGVTEHVMRSAETGKEVKEGIYQTGPKSYANMGTPETIQKIGNTYMNTGGASNTGGIGKEAGVYTNLVPVLDTIKKVGDTWMNVTKELSSIPVATPTIAGTSVSNTSEQKIYNISLSNEQINASPKMRELVDAITVELERQQRRQ